jgi:poly-gamma-glutamate synthesis protein (capsule biosynthesis protein)
MHAPPHLLDELVDMGCNLFSAASNHTFDYGEQGIRSTIKELEAANAVYAGIGENLYKARKPRYLETEGGRVALLSACTSISPESEASEQTSTLPGRPGLNPLHVEKIFRLTDENIDQLRDVSRALEFEEIKEEWRERDLYTGHEWDQEEYFHFMDMKFETVESESEMGIGYTVDESDVNVIHEGIEEAKQRADRVIMSIHCHQGAMGRRNTQTVPPFLSEFAKSCIDTGADMFVGHGPHKLRGIEVYEGKPIYYSLGNFIFQLETMSSFSPKMFDIYGVDDVTKPSRVLNKWLFDEQGEPRGYLAEPSFWRSVLPVTRFGSDSWVDEIELYPISLRREQSLSRRGSPVIAEGEKAESILDEIEELSSTFGTEINREGGIGRIEL